MTTPRYTQCPHCNATFKVTEEQLGIANGRVRCGACMNIFDAIAYSLPGKDETAPQPKKPQPAPSADDLLLEDEDLLFNDDPDEDKGEPGYSGKKQFSDELSDSFLALDENDSTHIFKEHSDTEKVEDAPDESWASGMLDDELSAQPVDRIRQDNTNKAPAATAKTTATPRKQPVAANPTAMFDDTINAPEHEPKPSVAPPKAPPRESGADWYTKEPTEHRHFERLTFGEATPAPGRSKLTAAILGVACLLLVVLLLAQASWFHYETLARYPQIATLYQKVCEHFSCQLPVLSDISKIRSNNLVVRSHPTLPKALIIETVLTNEAGFAQPFPDLGLYFSDINNKIIAQRRIKPAEYLSGELLSWEKFPVNQPVHISLEIMDPGKDAVNYNLKFFASEEPAAPITN